MINSDFPANSASIWVIPAKAITQTAKGQDKVSRNKSPEYHSKPGQHIANNSVSTGINLKTAVSMEAWLAPEK